MQVGNRIFPYPVLNSNKSLSNFGKTKFELTYSNVGSEETEDMYVFENLHYYTDSEYLNELIANNKVKVACIVENAESVYRQTYDITHNSLDLKVYKAEVTGKVVISIMAYANTNFYYEPDGVEEIYEGIGFGIEQYQIIAANDGFNFTVFHGVQEDTVVNSIFTIIRDANKENDYNYADTSFDLNRISITLSDKSYSDYILIKGVKDYEEIFFNLILVPALVEGIHKCREVVNKNNDIDDVTIQYNWFNSVLKAYEMRNGRKMTVDDLKDSNLKITILAQNLLGDPLGESLRKLKEIRLGVSDNASE